MPYKCLRAFLLLTSMALVCGCSSWQPTKNVWKSTKGLWNTYVSPPASVDYDDKGSISPQAVALAKATVGIDSELKKLERTMQNADRPPTQEWLSRLFASYPWLNGFAGVKYDGAILGQEPPDSIKQLDFIPLLYEDSKQHSRALRADVQPGPLGPEIMLAVPLYDGIDFLGIVVAYFDMRSLMHLSPSARDIVVLTPRALLWPGKYDYAATPLAGVDWSKVVRESTAGTCTNATGSFYYVIHYLGNLPIIFAIPEKGNFPEGNGNLEQAASYFPQEREKLPPPPMPERKNRSETGIPAFEKPQEPEPEPAPAPPAQPMPEASDRNVIPQGSRDSMLLKRGKARPARKVEERMLEGETVAPSRRAEPPVGLLPEQPAAPESRPSPFGPKDDSQQQKPFQRPSPFGPAGSAQDQESTPEPQTGKPEANEVETSTPAVSLPSRTETSPSPASGSSETTATENPATPSPTDRDESSQTGPAVLPGGRPSPFGPGR